MRLHEALQLVRFDKRLIDWHLKQGIITAADVEKHMKSLPDITEQAIKLDFEFDAHANGSIPSDQ